MNKDKIFKIFEDYLTSDKLIFKVGNGKETYKMDRGSFKTKDKIEKLYSLKYISKEDDTYIYGVSDIYAKIKIVKGDTMSLLFDVDERFNRMIFSLPSFKDEYIYGCGEEYSHLNLKGEDVKIWVSEHQSFKEIFKKLLKMKLFGPRPEKIRDHKYHQSYFVSPIYTSSKCYSVIVESNDYGTLSFRDDYTLISYRNIFKKINIFSEDDMVSLVKRLTEYVGISPRLPEFVHNGAILGIQGGTDVVKEKYNKVLSNGGKVSGIWSQDWCGNVVTSFGYQVFWNWKSDDELYKGMSEYIKELNSNGVHYLGYINTFLKENSDLFNEAKDKGYLVKHDDDTVYLIKSTTFDAGIVDLTNPSAYSWYKDVIKENMIKYGLSGWMADFGEYLPTDANIYTKNPLEMHNLWPTLWAKCSYDAIHEMKKEKDIFIFSRAAYTSTTKYTNSMWNGDQHVDYSLDYGIGSVIPASISSAMSGCGVIHSDIGGYTTVNIMKRDAELLIRWAAMNIFSPVFRTHEGNRPWDNVQFDDENVIKHFSKFSQIFYDLKEYRMDVEDEYQIGHIPMIRPLFLHYNREDTYLERNEYLFGRDILVSPVIKKGEVKHEVYLPDDEFIQFFTGETFKGGRYIIDSPINLPIAFYRKESKFKKLFDEITEKYKKEV